MFRFAILAWLALSSAAALAQDPPSPEAPEPTPALRVGVKPAPPFAMEDDSGSWGGLTVSLWQEIARDLGYDYTFEERDLAGLLDGLEDGSLDVVAAALTITGEREKRLDFSHPFFATGLGIAVPATGSVMESVSGLVSTGFLRVVAALGAVLLLVGLIVWVFERRKNPDEFGGGLVQGLMSGFWWSAVTMTTVGYGDKSPRTVGGRLVGLVWMFASIIVISSFTAAIASSLTVGRLSSSIQGAEDLRTARVGTVTASASVDWLDEHKIRSEGYADVEEAMAALASGEIDAVVHDQPLLQYVAHNDYAGQIVVLPGVLDQQYYGLGLSPDSHLREAVNQVLLDRIDSEWWSDQRYRYLGD